MIIFLILLKIYSIFKKSKFLRVRAIEVTFDDDSDDVKRIAKIVFIKQNDISSYQEESDKKKSNKTLVVMTNGISYLVDLPINNFKELL